MTKGPGADDVIEILDSEVEEASSVDVVGVGPDGRLGGSQNLSYLDQLEHIIYTVMESESHLFDEEEFQMIAMYKSLPSELTLCPLVAQKNLTVPVHIRPFTGTLLPAPIKRPQTIPSEFFVIPVNWEY